MSKAWIMAKLPEFTRDVMRDFCLAAQELEDQFRLYDETGGMDFDVLHELLGDEMNKGLLWGLKDTAHHVYRNDSSSSLVGRFLEWGLGYIFHETMKLKEDAYQRHRYAPWFLELTSRDLPKVESHHRDELMQILSQTQESIAREVTRIRFILSQCKAMFPLYFGRHRKNLLLARYLFEQNKLVRNVFGEDYDKLITGIYGAKEPERMFILAAKSLRQGGWMTDASRAVEEGLKVNPASKNILIEKALIEG